MATFSKNVARFARSVLLYFKLQRASYKYFGYLFKNNLFVFLSFMQLYWLQPMSACLGSLMLNNIPNYRGLSCAPLVYTGELNMLSVCASFSIIWYTKTLEVFLSINPHKNNVICLIDSMNFLFQNP